MDKYEWVQDQHEARVQIWHLIPRDNKTNLGRCRACIIQTGPERFIVHNNNVEIDTFSTHTGFWSVKQAKEFVERVVK